MWNFFFFCEWRIEIFEQHFHLQISIFFFLEWHAEQSAVQAD